MEVTQELFTSTFPHGVRAYNEAVEEVFFLVNPEVRETATGKIMVRMWGMVGKAFYFDITDPEEMAPNRWRVKTADGESTIFNPLREDQAKPIHINLENY